MDAYIFLVSCRLAAAQIRVAGAAQRGRQRTCPVDVHDLFFEEQHECLLLPFRASASRMLSCKPSCKSYDLVQKPVGCWGAALQLIVGARTLHVVMGHTAVDRARAAHEMIHATPVHEWIHATHVREPASLAFPMRALRNQSFGCRQLRMPGLCALELKRKAVPGRIHQRCCPQEALAL